MLPLNKILVVNVNWLGDVIFSSPVFTNLRRVYPRAKIVCMAVPRVREILECVPGIDDIIVYDEDGRHHGLFGSLAMIQHLRREKFDAVFYIHNSLTRAWLGFLAGIPARVGFDVKGRGVLLTHKFPDPKDSIHRSDRYLNVIERFGVSMADRTNVVHVQGEAKNFIQALLHDRGVRDGDFKIVVNLGGNWDLKKWPRGHFSMLIERLMSDLNAKVIIPGARKDISLAREVCAPLTRKPVILAGETNLKQLMALMQSVDLVISADSGPLHIANAVGADVIGIFGATSLEIATPRGSGRVTVLRWDVGCNRGPCYYLECPDNICMRAVSVDDVVNAVKNVFANTTTGRVRP